MKVKCFADTGTALLEFSDHEVVEARDINENIIVDLDMKGDLVSIIIEHAKQRKSLPDVVVEQFGRGAASPYAEAET